jgi:outer membrane protein insertion porin family
MALSSCNYNKHLQPSEQLLWGNRINITAQKKLNNNNELMSQLNAAVVQKPNSVIFGLDLETFNLGRILPRTKLGIYNFMYKPIEKDSQYFYLNKKVAERPVSLSKLAIDKSKLNLKKVMMNQGYFYAEVTDSIRTYKHNRAGVYYNINPGKNYILKSVQYEIKNKAIEKLLLENNTNSFLKYNDIISFSKVASERNRISALLIENGYYNFRPSVITPQIDTQNAALINALDNPFEQLALITDTSFTQKQATGDVKFIFDDSINGELIQPYFFKNIIVNIVEANGNITSSKKMLYSNTYRDINFAYNKKVIDFDLLCDNIYVHKNELFSPREIDATLRRLNNMGSFRNVSVNLENADTNSNMINCIFTINMLGKYSSVYELDASQAKAYDIGAGINVGIRDNNFLKQGNQLNISLQGGLFYNLKRDRTLVDSAFKFQLFRFNYGINTDVNLPKFLGFNRYNLRFNKKLPTTTIAFGLNNYTITNSFSQQSINAKITYSWQQNNVVKWSITPLLINKLFTQTDNLIVNDNIKKSLSPFFIVGSSASFTYNTQLPAFQYHYTYLRLGIEKSGALASLFSKDSDLARFTIFDVELKHYINTKHSSWVNRIFTFYGMPNGNNNTIPYLKQQSAGGQFSLRGWRPFEIGPGSNNIYRQNNLTNVGEIKIETNTEYRFDMFKLFSGFIGVKGALFADAGNIWRFSDTTDNGKAQFKTNKLWKDMAVDGGVGLRFDFKYAILRIDEGVQLRRPYETANNGWANFKDINIGNKEWRRNNAYFTIGINYPF